jgi:alkaline phosphatase
MSRPTQRSSRHILTGVAVTVIVLVVALAIGSRFAPWELSIGNLVLRSQRGVTAVFEAPASAQLVEVAGRAVELGADDPRPRNIVLMIGDGVGIGQVSTASAALHGPAGGLTVETAPVTGLVRTSAGNNLVTDSAAASSAMATGFKVPKQSVATLADGRLPVSITRAAKEAGLSTGLLTTSGLADATPAGFLVHAAHRYNYAEILTEILATDHDVLIGGSWIHHHRARRDHEYLDLVGRIDSLGSSAGFNVVHDAADLATTRPPILALFPPRGQSADAHGPELAVTTDRLLDALADLDAGFLAVIESEVPDGVGHRNDVTGVVDAVREFDQAVTRAVEWAAARGETLVIVTADHDTGGLGIVDGDYRKATAEVRWTTDYHTGLWVPLFAFGPGAEQFSGVLDNTEIGVRIADLLGIEDFPRLLP